MNAVIQALCWSLAGHTDEIDWATWGAPQWDAFLAVGQDQGVLPLLAHALEDAGWPASMPSAVRHTIESARYITTAHNLLMYAELARILRALASVSPVVVLKGAALGPIEYPRKELRPLSDIDLLVPEHHLEAANATLRTLGYVESALPQLAAGNNALGHHLCLHGGPGQHVAVELHWRLIGGAADRRSPQHAWFWQHTQPWQGRTESQVPTNDETPALHLTPTAHLLYLAAHLLLQHGGAQARLIWWYDLHLLITHHALAWPVLIEQARAFGWTAALAGALRGTHQFFGTPLPPHVLPALDAATSVDAARFVQQKAVVPPRSLRSAILDLQALRWPTRVRWVCRVLCPTPTYMCWRYQHWAMIRWVWLFCYPHRWVLALLGGVRSLVGRRTLLVRQHNDA